MRLVTAHQEDWSKWLPLATAVHNNSLNATLKTTPHQLLMGIDPPLTPNQWSIASNAVAHDQVQQLIEQHALAAAAINNKGQEVPQPQWQVGHKVWLEAKNLVVPYGTIKLAPR